MFTGIIQKVATILSVVAHGDCLRVRVEKPQGWKLTLGQSVAIDGICSTVVACGLASFDVEYMPETLVKTTVRAFKKGATVNLERSLSWKAFVDGGLVQGHVDCLGTVKKIEKMGETAEFHIAIPAGFNIYIAPQGSITVNGVNLTVTRMARNAFVVALIPFTLSHTNLRLLNKGDRVNVEVDMLARYVVAALKP